MNERWQEGDRVIAIHHGRVAKVWVVVGTWRPDLLDGVQLIDVRAEDVRKHRDRTFRGDAVYRAPGGEEGFA